MSFTPDHSFGDFAAGGSTTIQSDVFTLAAGQVAIVGLRQDDAAKTVLSITDTAGNRYVPLGVIYLTGALELWGCLDTGADASNQITATFSASATNRGIVVGTFTPDNTVSNMLDTIVTPTTTTTNAPTSLSFSTRFTNSFGVCVMDINATGTTWTAGSGYTKLVEDASNVMMLQYGAYAALQTMGTIDAGSSNSGTIKRIVAAVLTDDGGGGGGATDIASVF